MAKVRKVYPSDVTEEEWWFVLPYLLLCREDAGQREHELRDVFDAVQHVARSGCAWRMKVLAEEKRSPGQKDIHHLLMARTMQWRIPIQLILPGTYDESKARKQKRAGTPRPLQDEAMKRHDPGTYFLRCAIRREVRPGVLCGILPNSRPAL